ncbi:hypothetical protein [Olsenella sp. An290]|uniref:ATP-grasp domain-containing protein n=1 Tax=Olsenella sp. An290 TaxID=1965625 RepID=UPI000B36DF49|nr:hypothetical protein [Olsenella sp. An290]OUO32619.1 hypothetical protein B5F84_09200 [Olsenella sp. An290]
MNVVFVSPQFPEVYWRFCAALRRNGARALGIGDTPYDNLLPELKGALDEYYWVPDLSDYDQVFRAVAFFSFKYGKVDWIESNNEHWLAQDARLREDFNVLAGPRPHEVATWQSKAAQKPLYAAAGVPTAHQTRLTTFDETRWFIGEMGHFPVFAKPEVGVGSVGARQLTSDDDLRVLLAEHGDVPYVIEQCVEGDICSYDAIVDSQGRPLFENQEEFPPSMADVAQRQLDLSYRSCPDVDPRLAELGRATVRAFGLRSRFVHLEFFRLSHDLLGLGSAGDYVGLEVNARPPGGSTPEMMCWAHGLDVFQAWADMLCFDELRTQPEGTPATCVYAARRDAHRYAHAHEEVLARWGDAVVSCGRVPRALSDDMGDYQYTARFSTSEEADEFVAYVQEGRRLHGDQASG